MAQQSPPPPAGASKPFAPWRVKTGHAAPWLAALLLLCVFVQASLAAFGIFGNPDFIDVHKVFIHVFEVLPLALAIVGFIGRDHAAGWSGVAVIVMIQAQYGFIYASEGMVQALHVVNAFLIFGVSLVLASRRLPWARRA